MDLANPLTERIPEALNDNESNSEDDEEGGVRLDQTNNAGNEQQSGGNKE